MMVRRVARLIDPTDVLGVIGFALIAYGAGLYDPRLPFLIAGLGLFVLALARAWRAEPTIPLRSAEEAIAEAQRRSAA